MKRAPRSAAGEALPGPGASAPGDAAKSGQGSLRRPRDADLPHESLLPVLGVPVRLRTDAPELLEAFEEALGYWRVLEGRPDLVSAGVPVEGRLWIRGGGEGSAAPPVAYEVQGGRRLRVTTPGSVGLADPARREFTGAVTRQLASDRTVFGPRVLESMVLSVVSWLDRQPVHASAVARRGTALLLCAPSGRGKSTLAYAAARAGLEVLADDAVFVQTRPLRVWGRPGTLHLPPDSPDRFPELARHAPRRVASGKEKVALEVAALGAAPSLPIAERAGVCLLDVPRPGPPRAEPVDPDDVARALLAQLEAGFDLFRDGLPALARGLAAGGAWRLQAGSRPEEAIAVLRRLLDEVEGRAAPAS